MILASFERVTSREIRKQFLEFFHDRSHAVVASSSLIPDDPSVLLTTAGMQQFKKYYTGAADAEKDFGSKNTVSVQKSFRTSDIDEVGDESHLTFFEMLGNFSFGGYQKKESITYAFDFITKVMNLPISHVTVFEGSPSVPRDEESRAYWNELGVRTVLDQGMDDVFWGPTGTSGPCGPTTEIYCRNAQGQDIEVWNIVFNQFFCNGSREQLLKGVAKLSDLPLFGIDTGMGLERLAMISQGTETLYETDLFLPLAAHLPSGLDERTRRIVLDHVRSSSFLISDGVRPSNKERGYVLRRLMRRTIVHVQEALGRGWRLEPLIKEIVAVYSSAYPELSEDLILGVWNDEKSRFEKTLRHGLKELGRATDITAKVAFTFYESYGLPYEIVKEMGGMRASALTREAFEEEFKKHQEVSRAGVEKKFGGHGLLLDTGELKAKDDQELALVTRLHTATHLLQASLRIVLGAEVSQRGSDITAERARFDFSFSRKMTPEEISTVENMINEVIDADIPMQVAELPIEEAKKTGALTFFREKYPERVKVYFAGATLAGAFSKEFCGGPHVARTGEVEGIKIVKEEAVGAGVRRIRAALVKRRGS